MKKKEFFGIIALFLAGLVFAFILTFILLNVLPTHPGNQEHKQVMQYLTPGVKADISFLEADEHMQDVKILVNSAFILFVLCVFLLYKMNFELRERFAGYGLLLLVAFFAGMALKGFGGAWVQFHQVFFPQGGWQFPIDSTLITLYPESYFFGAALVFAAFVVLLAAAFIQGAWYKRALQKLRLR